MTVHITAISDTRNDLDFNAKVYARLDGADTVRCRVKHVFDLVDEVLEAAGGRPVRGLDIVGHGRAGMMRLGLPRHGFETVLSPHSPSFTAIREIASVLTDDAVIRLLGCNVGRVEPTGDSGPVLQLAMSHLLGRPVAAAVHPIFPRDFSGGGFRPDDPPGVELLSVIDHGSLSRAPVEGVGRAFVDKPSAAEPFGGERRFAHVELWKPTDAYSRGWNRVTIDHAYPAELERLAAAIRPRARHADVLAEPECYFALRHEGVPEVIRGRICLGWRALVVTPGDPAIVGPEDTLFELDAVFGDTIAQLVSPWERKRETS